MGNLKATAATAEAEPLSDLKAWLERTETTQEALARFLGVSQSMVSLYVNGKRNLELKLVVNLALLTGLPVEKLLTGDDAAAILKVLGKRTVSGHRKAKDNDRVA